MLVLSRKVNETIVIGDDIEIMVVALEGDRVRLGVKAPPGVSVHRGEIYEAIREENRRAAETKGNIKGLMDGLSAGLASEKN